MHPFIDKISNFLFKTNFSYVFPSLFIGFIIGFIVAKNTINTKDTKSFVETYPKLLLNTLGNNIIYARRESWHMNKFIFKESINPKAYINVVCIDSFKYKFNVEYECNILTTGFEITEEDLDSNDWITINN